MDKTVIKLYIPCIEQEYDVRVPTFLTVGEVIPLLSKAVSNLSDGKYSVKDDAILCVKERNLILEYQYLLSDYGIKNGDCLVLF